MFSPNAGQVAGWAAIKMTAQSDFLRSLCKSGDLADVSEKSLQSFRSVSLFHFLEMGDRINHRLSKMEIRLNTWPSSHFQQGFLTPCWAGPAFDAGPAFF